MTYHECLSVHSAEYLFSEDNRIMKLIKKYLSGSNKNSKSEEVQLIAFNLLSAFL